jgi:predicted GNAT family acetyltransferase
MGIEVHRRNHDYEITVDGAHAGVAEFEARPGVVVFTHTVIEDAFEGQGLGSQLARAVLDDALARGLSVDPVCPFIRRWIERHPDYQDLAVQVPHGGDGKA